MLQQIDQTRETANDEAIETILACCYRIARERARQMQLVETRDERDETREREEAKKDDEK